MKTRCLFIDRDGTLLEEPYDEQVDALEKIKFLPGVFLYLGRIAKLLDYKLVMVTNQDGLGTDSFPEDTFWPAHNKMLQAFENEGIIFDDILIDKSFPKENAPTRKPRTGLLKEKYMNGDYDLANSYVLGDRATDIELAKNIGAKGIFIADEKAEPADTDVQALQTTSWEEIYEFLKNKERIAVVKRYTNETKIDIKLELLGNGSGKIDTGIKFFDHMLEQISRHGSMNLDIKVNGDLEVDEHHTIEDTAIALGEAFKQALGNKRGIERYGFNLPMDDCLAQVALDFGGRNWLVWDADFNREKVGEMPTEMFFHFFKSFSDGALCNLNIKAEGTNEHHKIEGIFKAFAKSLKMAVKQNFNDMQIPSTKGSL